MRILLCEVPGLFRDSVRTLLTDVASVDGVAPFITDAHSADDACRAAATTQPDIALISATLPPDGGIRAAGSIARAAPRCRIVLIVDSRDQGVLIRAVQAGATGIAARMGPLSELVAAVVAAIQGEAYVPPMMLEGLMRRAAGKADEGPESRIELLTDRERQVLVGLALGDSSTLLARRLGISSETARTHVQNVLSKLGVHSRLEAAALARRSGIIESWSVTEAAL